MSAKGASHDAGPGGPGRGLPPSASGTGRWNTLARLLTDYFRSADWKMAWWLLAVVAACRFGATGVAIAFTYWERELFDALGDRDPSNLGFLILTFIGLGLLTVVFAITDVYSDGALRIRWRRFLTDRFAGRWLSDALYLEIEETGRLDNPDQRIAEDIRLFIKGVLELGLGLLRAVISAIGFAAVLWSISVSAPLRIGGTAIPGDLFWFALLFALVGSGLVSLFWRRFVSREMRQQHYEADFRFGLIAVRTDAEAIAMTADEPRQHRSLDRRFGRLMRNFYALLRVRTGVTGISRGYDFLRGVLPIFIVLPRYFAGAMSLGEVMQARSSFSQFSTAVSWFIQVYPTIVFTTATFNRLHELERATDAPVTPQIDRHPSPRAEMETHALLLDLPDGSRLVDVGDWTVREGEHWLVRGASGSGKSVLLRALAGRWSYGSGEMTIPYRDVAMAVPQTGFVPAGMLRDYFAEGGSGEARHTDAEISAVLEQVDLGNLVDRLAHEDDWARRLSPGERQRLAIARVLLRRPRFLILDEATSAVDDALRERIWALIAGLPATIISASHRHDEGRWNGTATITGGRLLLSQTDDPIRS